MENPFCLNLVENLLNSVSSSALAIRRNVKVFLIIELLIVTKGIINPDVNAYKRLLQMKIEKRWEVAVNSMEALT